jgi:lipid II:glycine glycyltransferase (peptidoglycan interpeptide bridge formation enzyme)
MLYSPLLSESQLSDLKSRSYISKIKSIAQESQAIFYRVEFDSPLDHVAAEFEVTNSHFSLHDSCFKKAFEEMQPEHTIILDISQSEADILAQMKQKGRYNIKIAERAGITISSSESRGAELDQFYELYKTMAVRQKISYRNKAYFEALLEILGERQYARCYNATIADSGGEQILAAAIIGFCDHRATYLFGGSSNERRNLMAPYLLHWQIIREAKARGFSEYDFFGIAPCDNPNHPWAGVTRFKKQFGGQEVHLAGSWDLVFRPAEYQLFKIAEKIRR